MKERLYATVFAALAMTGYSTVSLAESDAVSWKRIIGIIQAGNTVSGISGGGQPWSTLGGEARVSLLTGTSSLRFAAWFWPAATALGRRALLPR